MRALVTVVFLLFAAPVWAQAPIVMATKSKCEVSAMTDIPTCQVDALYRGFTSHPDLLLNPGQLIFRVLVSTEGVVVVTESRHNKSTFRVDQNPAVTVQYHNGNGVLSAADGTRFATEILSGNVLLMEWAGSVKSAPLAELKVKLQEAADWVAARKKPKGPTS
jgi:hypothetical protein